MKNIIYVRTGDSILLKSDNQSILIDGGNSSYYIGSLYKYLLNIKPSAFLATHFHSDHISGLLNAVENNYDYDLFLNLQDNDTYEAKKLSDLAISHGYKSLHQGDILKLGNFSLKVLWPVENCQETVVIDVDMLNYCSVVLLVSHKNGGRVLLTSDSESPAQERYLDLLTDVDYLKVPHQGSKDSLNPNFLHRAHPENAVISVGENNYGHPSQEVLDYYTSDEIKILRTDEVGDIILVFE